MCFVYEIFFKDTKSFSEIRNLFQRYEIFFKNLMKLILAEKIIAQKFVRSPLFYTFAE